MDMGESVQMDSGSEEFCLLEFPMESKMQCSSLENWPFSQRYQPFGIGIGMMTVVGQCLGAGRQDEAIYYIKKLSVIAEAVIIGCCALVYILTRPVTMLGGMEPESAKMCFYMIGWITVVKPIVWTLAFVPAYGMLAAGDVRFSMILSCISMWLFRVTLCIYLCRVHGFGPIAVWIGMFTDWTVRGIVFTIRFKSRRWLAHEVV